MARSSSARRGISRPTFLLQKPTGELADRVKAVAPNTSGSSVSTAPSNVPVTSWQTSTAKYCCHRLPCRTPRATSNSPSSYFVRPCDNMS
jgi:hypothetical protein